MNLLTSSILSRHAMSIDHVAIAVTNLQQSIFFFKNLLGFEVTEKRLVHGEFSGMNSATIRAGKVTFVLVEATNDKSNVAQYIANYGPGVQHIAIEVSDIQEVIADLKARGFELITGIIKGPGLKQAFSTRDPVSGVMLEIIQRTNNEGFDDKNVAELFKAMEQQGVY